MRLLHSFLHRTLTGKRAFLALCIQAPIRRFGVSPVWGFRFTASSGTSRSFSFSICMMGAVLALPPSAVMKLGVVNVLQK